MSLSPLAYADSLRVGTIDFVSPDEIKVQLDIEAPDRMALNTGTPRPFPRVNEYVLIPDDEGYLVAQVGWVTVERSQYPKRKGMQDFGLVDLPYPLRKMSLAPMGILSVHQTNERDEESYLFHRGVRSYPTVGDPVLIPTRGQLRAIVESGLRKLVLIGHSPLAADAEVRIDPDRLFSRHLAVLGNTGSGKSCSVAGLIRWSLEAAKKERNGRHPNARFIVLDPNGEYSNTFQDLGNVRVFSVRQDVDTGKNQLQVPLWLWNSEEWATFTKASGRTQRPVLVQALRSVRDNVFVIRTASSDMRRYLRTLISALQMAESSGDPWRGTGPVKGFRDRLSTWRNGLNNSDSFTDEESTALDCLKTTIDDILSKHQSTWPAAFSRSEIRQIMSALSSAHAAFGGSDNEALPISPDIPRPFSGDQFIRSVEANAELLNVSEHVETMIMRIRTLLADSRLKIVSGDTVDLSLEQWLTDYIGGNKAENGSISVIDLSLVPAQVVQIVTAVIARMTLEALQRYRKYYDGKVLPTVLVMEEAHTFIKRYQQDSDDQSASRLCTEVFEKIAREGRKFGLGLVLSSQRPSELSPTVLSQCNSFLLHRISNDRDQELVHRLVPDNMHGLMRDLPVLPVRQAILLGWASELPVLVEMNELPMSQQPKSSDPDFWAVWSGQNDDEREVDWKAIADDWQENEDMSTSQDNNRSMTDRIGANNVE